jgi:hypothetical protein
VEDEVFEVDEFALKPEGGAAFRKMRAGESSLRTGLRLRRSSRRAAASSARASGAAMARQGIGSGKEKDSASIIAGSDKYSRIDASQTTQSVAPSRVSQEADLWAAIP